MTKHTTPIEFPAEVKPPAIPASFTQACEEFGLAFEPGELEGLASFLGFLLTVNEKMNLTAIRDADGAWIRHIFDALTLLPLLGEIPEGGEVADIGSGGGLPAIPLAIVLPHLKFTLIEATAKKADYLSAAVAFLGLKNVRVFNGRAEEFGQDFRTERERYDAVTARAVGRMPMLLELTVPLAKAPDPEAGIPGGQVILVKGEKAAEEIAEAKQAMHMLHCAHAGTVETQTGRIVVIEKLRKTPRTYPRAVGEPKRSPLGVRP
ncbi:MAG: 16S rRNA (guanine(527)-N(7))-methyltransferase RsmG [Phycisphaerales bacterium JB050]